MLTKDEIVDIIDDHVFSMEGAGVGGVLEAAEAIAARLTRAHRMSEFVGLCGGSFVYIVPDKDGWSFRVAMEPARIWCWGDDYAICSDSNEGTTCDHVKAVKLHLEREGKS